MSGKESWCIVSVPVRMDGVISKLVCMDIVMVEIVMLQHTHTF